MNSAFYPVLFVLLWSTGFIGAKLGLPDAEPLTFLTWRHLGVTVLMLILVLVVRAPWPRSPRLWLHIAISGVLVNGVYLAGVFIAIAQGLPAGTTALVVGMQPVLTGLMSSTLFGERVLPVQWIGLTLGLIGTVMVVAQNVDPGQIAALPSMLIPAIVALFGITAGTLYQKRFCPTFDLRTGSVIQFAPCLLLTGAAAMLTETMKVTWSASFVFALAWLVLVLSIGAVALLNLLIRRGSAVHVASLFYLTPPITAVIAWMLFGEALGLWSILGLMVAAGGVYLAHRR